MLTLNRVQLAGHLGRDPEIKYTATNKAVCRFSLAVGSRKKGPDGKWVDGDTYWASVECWEELAEEVNATLRKGDACMIEGSLKREEWEKDGVKKEATRITAQFVSRPVYRKRGTTGTPDPRSSPQRAGNRPEPTFVPDAPDDSGISF